MTTIEIDDYFGKNDEFKINEVSLNNVGIYDIIRTDVVGGIVASKLENCNWISLETIKREAIDVYKDIIDETVAEAEEKLIHCLGKEIHYPDKRRYTNKEVAENFMYENWHILYETKDIERFINYAQLYTLRRKTRSVFHKNRHKQYKNVDAEKVMEIVYNNYIKGYKSINEIVMNCRGCESTDLDMRDALLSEGRELLYRLDNEELRDIIFMHPFTDLDDSAYDDRRVNDEGLDKDNVYDSSLAKKIIDKCENAPCDVYKKHLKELKNYRG